MKINANAMELKAAERGFSLTRLAKESGVSRATITTIKKNQSCSGQVFLKIAKTLKVDPKELFLKEE